MSKYSGKSDLYDLLHMHYGVIDDKGNVEAVAIGTADITCQSESNPDAKDVCKVTVEIKVTKVTLSQARGTKNANL